MEKYNYQMQTIGFSIINNYINVKKCNKIKKIIIHELKLYKDYGTQRSKLDKDQLHDLICKYIDIGKLLEDVRLNSLIAQLLGEHWIMYACTGSSCPPNSTNYGGRVHVDSPRWINNYITNVGAIWVLDDFTKDNGGTRILPGSHHSNIIPTKKYFEENSIIVEVPKGSLIIFNARLVHNTGFNSTNKWRHALTMNACRPYMKQRMDWVRFIPNDIIGKLNPTAKRIIGFDTRLPSSLEEFYQPEESRLYKSNQE